MRPLTRSNEELPCLRRHDRRAERDALSHACQRTVNGAQHSGQQETCDADCAQVWLVAANHGNEKASADYDTRDDDTQ
jgi:hypothetical protein